MRQTPSLLRSAAQAASPIPSNTTPVPGSFPTEPLGRMNFVLPLGKQNSSGFGDEAEIDQSTAGFDYARMPL